MILETAIFINSNYSLIRGGKKQNEINLERTLKI